MTKTEELLRLLDEFEHECYMLRVEASETRAKDEVVRDAYERIREESARAISATLNEPKPPCGGGYCPMCSATRESGRVTENSIDKWMRSFQSEHGELEHTGPDELRELAFALHDDIPLGYEASMRLGQWLLHATLDVGKLTAERVRDAVMSADRWKKPMGNTGLTNTHLIIRDDGWQAIADELNAALGEADEGCYLVRDGKKFPVELDYGFVGIMPIAITVAGLRYLLEVPNGE